MSQEQDLSDVVLPEDGLAPSCTEGARSYSRAEQTDGLELAWTLEFTAPDELADVAGTPLSDGPSPSTTTSPFDLFDYSIDVNDSIWVPTGRQVDRLYCGLATSQWDQFETACVSENGSADWQQSVTALLKQFRDWKFNSITRRACLHECIFAQLLDENTAPIRGFVDDEEGRRELFEAVTPAQTQVAATLRQLSIAIAEAYGLFSSRLYRGLGYHLPAVAEAVFTDPSRTRYLSETEFSVLTNFTLDREVASRFSEILLEIDLTEESLVSAPDFLTHTAVYFTTAGEWRPVPEAEIRVRGDALTDISREQITIAGTTADQPSFPEVVARIPESILEYDTTGPPLFSHREHLALREAALAFAEYEYTESGGVQDVAVEPPAAPAALDRLSIWLDIFDAEFEPRDVEGPNKTEVQTIIEQVIETGRS